VVDERHVQLPRIGTVRVKETTTKFRGRILSATVKREADRWYVSLRVEVEREVPHLGQQGVVGVDCNTTAIVTTEGVHQLPKPLRRKLRLLRSRSKQHSRKQRGSNNRRKSALRLARLHRKIRNMRRDYLHQLYYFAQRRKGRKRFLTNVFFASFASLRETSGSPLSRVRLRDRQRFKRGSKSPTVWFSFPERLYRKFSGK
jgi:transposase